MTNIQKFSFAAFAMLIALIFIWFFVACPQSPFAQPPVTRIFHVGEQELTEDLAIEYATQTLTDAGLSVPNMKPVQYWPDSEFEQIRNAERYFARNRKNPDTGWVYWDIGYSVHVTKTEDRIECVVIPDKFGKPDDAR